jgi:hypothetical protein
MVANGREVSAYEGETVAAALLAAGHRILGYTHRGSAPRGYFCGMGLCHDCLMIVDDVRDVRTCTTAVREGLRIETQRLENAGGDDS